MVLLTTSEDSGLRLIPPPLHLLLPRSRPYTCRPVASADDGSSGQPSTSGQPTSTSEHISSAGSSSRPSQNIHILPKGLGGAGLGIGIGGGAFLGSSGPAKAVCTAPGGSCKAAGSGGKKKKRVLILMSNTGGGHRASAEAIKAAFMEQYGDAYEIFIVDMWKLHTPAPFNTLPDSYSFLVQHSILWRLTYEITNPRAFHIPYLATIGALVYKGVSEAFDVYKPDLVVSVHPLMQHIPIRVMRDRIKDGTLPPTNFATVVTDFTTCHNTWFCPQATRVFVPTDFCRQLAVRQGMSADQIIQRGLPIRPAFSKRLPARKRLRKQLGMDASVPAVLLVGGGEGMGALEDTVAQLDKELGSSAQVVVVCGRNQKLQERLQARPQGGKHLKVIATGFVDNIHEWMGASDVIITKAGPGTIAEALIAGLPILLNGNVPCQEEGNIPYVVDNGVGTFETRPAEIARIVTRWLDPAAAGELAAMAARSKALGKPEAVYQIAADLAGLAAVADKRFGPASVAAPGSGKSCGGCSGGANSAAAGSLSMAAMYA